MIDMINHKKINEYEFLVTTVPLQYEEYECSLYVKEKEKLYWNLIVCKSPLLKKEAKIFSTNLLNSLEIKII